MPAAPEVVLTEVGPRDGLQNEPGVVPTADKVSLVSRLAAAGLREIEVTSFVSPKWISALADADAVAGALPRAPGVRYGALVPNLAGWERFRAARLDVAAVFVSALKSTLVDCPAVSVTDFVSVTDWPSRTNSARSS